MCKELTEKELQSTNGCGSSHWLLQIFRIPKWLSKGFTRCCSRHDIRYQNLEDKAMADDELLDCWYYNAYHSPWWQKYMKLKLANLGYAAVTSKASELAYKKCVLEAQKK